MNYSGFKIIVHGSRGGSAGGNDACLQLFDELPVVGARRQGDVGRLFHFSLRQASQQLGRPSASSKKQQVVTHPSSAPGLPKLPGLPLATEES
jgi:hypothetical protein